MARPRKNSPKPNTQELSLVPVEEQPYPLPEGWKWVRLGEIITLISGRDATIADCNDRGVGTPYILGASNLEGNSFSPERWIENPEVISLKNDILISVKGTIGKIYIQKEKSINISRQIMAIRPQNNVVLTFLYFFLASQSDSLKEKGNGLIPGVSRSIILELIFPLPPLDEQERIVTHIESLFAKLDEAKEKAESVLESYETRKAAILHKAFAGELTEKWREERGIEKESWKNVTVGEICHDVKVGIVIKPSQYYTDQNQGTPAFRSANVRENHIDNFDWVYLNSEGMTNNKRCIVHTGDVLVVRSGNPGTACVVTEEFDGYNAIDILIAVPDQSKVIPQYLCSFTNSPLGKKSVAAGKRGMALAHFNVKGYSALTLELPTLPEQQEITRILDSLLEKEQQSKAAAEAVLEQIDLMKKAILAKAFRGELG